jgi:hypothetical protein
VSPESFNFTVTLPGDHRLIGVVRDLCVHAVGYARLSPDAGASFCDRVADAARQAVADQPDASCRLVFDCTKGELRVTVGGRTLTQPLVA